MSTAETSRLVQMPGFIGAGKMGGAIIQGLLNTYPEIKILVYEKSSDARENLKKNSPAVEFTDSLSDLEKNSDVILVCVKPQDLNSVLSQLSGQKQYISIAAGVSTETIRKNLKNKGLIARAMPNIAAQIGQSVTGFYCEDPKLSETTKNIFECLGFAFKLDKEEQMHAVTALAGSGPAYIFSLIQALAEGGVLCGLPFELALKISCLTVKGSASLAAESGSHPSVLRNTVTSPGGTTIEGLSVLESGGFHGLVMKAVRSAFEKSKNLEII
ncbi:MAG: pyrroline-5-carboxylate reductase [Spirochaetia bacterium]|nr:pyrroline-5-carboxylate reductase [Spirochaetia bacterium]